MNDALLVLMKKLESSALSEANVIPWGSPVPSFGDPSRSRIATLGLNPSNREFMDCSGRELDGSSRRFHTLRSLGIQRWSDVEEEHLNLIVDSCRYYFDKNPYDSWFKRLDYVISGSSASYYDYLTQACHLDLIPFATACKWTDLSTGQRNALLKESSDILAMLLQSSKVQMLVLNGSSVIVQFQKATGATLMKERMPGWDLPRKSKSNVAGYAYSGSVNAISGIKLKRTIFVAGYNHNIQSSFGVTRQVINSIRDWITEMAKEVM